MDDVLEDELAGRDEDAPLELGLLVMRLLLVGDVALPLLDAPEPVCDPDALPENVMVPEGLAEKLPDSVGEDTGGPLSGGALPEDSTEVLLPHRHIYCNRKDSIITWSCRPSTGAEVGEKCRCRGSIRCTAGRCHASTCS